MEQPELGIEVPHLQYWTNDGEFTQVGAADSIASMCFVHIRTEEMIQQYSSGPCCLGAVQHGRHHA